MKFIRLVGVITTTLMTSFHRNCLLINIKCLTKLPYCVCDTSNSSSHNVIIFQKTSLPFRNDFSAAEKHSVLIQYQLVIIISNRHLVIILLNIVMLCISLLSNASFIRGTPFIPNKYRHAKNFFNPRMIISTHLLIFFLRAKQFVRSTNCLIILSVIMVCIVHVYCERWGGKKG